MVDGLYPIAGPRKVVCDKEVVDDDQPMKAWAGCITIPPKTNPTRIVEIVIENFVLVLILPVPYGKPFYITERALRIAMGIY